MTDFGVEPAVRQLAWLLLGASAVGFAASRVRIPYAVALVLGGLLAAQTHLVSLPQLEPNLVLFLFLPPLLFDGAFRLDSRELTAVFSRVLLLAVPGTLLTALVVGGLVALFVDLPLPVALLFGSVVAATDPIAVVAVFRWLKAPHRLSVVLEAESLLNDGIAITLFVTLTGVIAAGTPDLFDVAGLFIWEVLGGVLIGGLSGWTFSQANRAIDDHLTEMTLSTALAYGSYLAAETIGVSGAIACVVAGLIHGSYGRRIGMSEDTRRRLDDLWEYMGFLANSMLFLLVGFSVHLESLVEHVYPLAVAILAVLLARILVVSLTSVATRQGPHLLTAKEEIVLVWGGLRGALTIALALALPVNTPARELVIALAFGVVLFTLVVQGITLSWLVRRLGLGRISSDE